MLFYYGKPYRTNFGNSTTAKYHWYRDRNSNGVASAHQSEYVLAMGEGRVEVEVEVVLDLVTKK